MCVGAAVFGCGGALVGGVLVWVHFIDLCVNENLQNVLLLYLKRLAAQRERVEKLNKKLI